MIPKTRLMQEVEFRFKRDIDDLLCEAKDKHMTIREISDWLGVSEPRIQAWIAQRLVQTYRPRVREMAGVA